MRYVVRMLAIIALAAIMRPTVAKEIMTERCSAEVEFVYSYNAPPGSGGILLKRNNHGEAGWTAPFSVVTDKSGYIRWWCHSTTGNAFDPGTWRIEDLFVGTKCQIYADGTPEKCSPDGNFKIGSSAWNGWTAERSRCGDRSRKIRASLGRDRLLQIECLGK